MANPGVRQHESSDPGWSELEEVLAAFARVAKSDAPFGHVAQKLVDLLVDKLAAVGAAVWLRDTPDALRLERQFNVGVLGDAALSADHRRLLLDVMRSGQPEAIAAGDAPAARNPTPHTLVLAPITIDAGAAGVVEVIQDPSIGAQALRGNLRFAALLAELAADHLRRREVRELRGLQETRERFEEFLLALHGSLDPRVVASVLANEGRRLAGFDRASVALRRGRRYRLIAVSSVDVIERRSPTVRRLERLAARLAPAGASFWHDPEDAEVAPEIEACLADFLNESHARELGVIPLRAPRHGDAPAAAPVIGALVVESFDAAPAQSEREAAESVALHGGAALAAALAYRSLPTLPLMRRGLRSTGLPTRRLAKVVATLTILTAIASALLVQVDFNVHADGELRPAVRRHVFAPLDGQVLSVDVSHGQRVEVGQPLVLLESPELELEIQKTRGEHEATRRRVAAVESELLEYTSSVDPDGERVYQLSAEQEVLGELLASQQRRLELLHSERDKLVVRSPIAGEVLTWETETELMSRPVRRGSRLLTISDLSGPWEAELRAPDEDVGPLLRALADSGAPLTADFQLATEQGVDHPGVVRRVAGRTELDAGNNPVVRVVLSVDAATLDDPRPGATVHARAHCGRRSVGYVWCHDLIDRLLGWIRL